MIEFPSNGSTAGGYLATPESGSGPGVIVIQEWWGLVDHIKDVCDRFAAAGFVALAPDLYHGQKVPPGEPDEAGKAMMAMKMDQAARDMSGAVDEVLRRSAGDTGRRDRLLHGRRAGARAGHAATRRRGRRRALLRHHPVARRAARLRGHVGRRARALRRERRLLHARRRRTRSAEQLRALGKSVEIIIYPGTDHAFFNDTRPEVYDADASPARCGTARWRSSPSTAASAADGAATRPWVRPCGRRSPRFVTIASCPHAPVTCPAAPACPPPVRTRSSWPRRRPSRPT